MALSDSRRPKVPFVSLVESGKIVAGTQLRLNGKDAIMAVVHEDGTISACGHRGSIHKVGALCLSTPSCNGWINWYYTDEASGEQRLLDHLRSPTPG
jgi:modification methylase